MPLGFELKRLARHSLVYGLGGIVSRILAVLLLPLYTSYLGPKGFGKIETVVALTTVLVIVLRLGISSAFFRFYFDSPDPDHRTLGLQFDRQLFRQMNHFGMPLVPSALALWAINFIDRIFIAQFKGQAEVGIYSVAVRISSAIVFLMIAFRLAWPAFAYSIEDDREAKRTYSFVLTYLLFVCSWVSLALGLLSPWLVRLLARGPGFHRASEAVALLAFGSAAYAGYTVLSIGVGRARATQFNWVISGAAAVVNVVLNVILIPP